MIMKMTFASFDEFSQAVKKYIDYYNNERIQVKTKWMSPVEYRKHPCVQLYLDLCVQIMGTYQNACKSLIS